MEFIRNNDLVRLSFILKNNLNNFKVKKYKTNSKKIMNKNETLYGICSNEVYKKYYKESRDLLTEHYNILINIRDSIYIEHLQKENNLDSLMPKSSKNIKNKLKNI